VKVGDIVTLTVNGKEFTGAVYDDNGTLRFSINVPGADLVADADHVIDASVTATDTAGNSATATDTEGYGVDTDIGAPTVWIVDDGTPGDGLLTQGEINSNGPGVQLQANVSHADLLEGGFVTLTVTIGNAQPQEYELELVNGVLQFTNGDPAPDFDYNNGVITWSEAAPDAGQSITVTVTQTDLAGNESAEDSDTAQVFAPANNEISVNESDLRDNVPNVVSQQISFTAGNEALTQFRFGDVSSIQAATNLATGVSIAWALALDGSLVGSIGGVPVIKLTLTDTDPISTNTTGSISVNVELLDNIKQVNGANDINLSSLIEGIVIEAVGENNSVISATLNVTINDDVIEASATNSSGLNAADTQISGTVSVAGADGNDNESADQYSADLSVNISGWSESSTYADSGLMTSGKAIYYYVDPDDTSVLIAYTSSSAAEWGAPGAIQTKIFTLTLDPNSGEYVLDLETPITKITSTNADLTGNIPGGNDEDLFVMLNGAVKGEPESGDVVLCTITATDSNGVSTVNTSPNGIGVGTGKDIGSGETLTLDFGFPVTNFTGISLSYNNGNAYTGVFTINIVGKDAYGNDLIKSFIATPATLANLIASEGFAEFTKIELSTAAGGQDFNLKNFTANSLSVDPLGTVLNFNAAIIDSDGDTDSNNPFTVTLNVPNALNAVTPAAFTSLAEAKLVSDTMDADTDTLVFKAGSSDVNNVSFSADVSDIQVEGIRQPMSWRIEGGVLIGSMPGRGDLLKLTLDWNAIEAGEQGSVVVEAELLGKLPHNVDYDSLTVTGIKVVATDTSGETAKADVTVTVADSQHIAADDDNHVDVLIDAFEVRDITARWTDWKAESSSSNVRTSDGPDDDNGHDRIRWGNVGYEQPRSGYNFDENTDIQVGDVGLNQNIILGNFTHVNQPINGYSSITEATLEVTLMINGVPAKVTLEFNHNETGGYNNPPDIVTVANTSSEFVYDGARYTLKVMGFLDSNGEVVTSIKTAEGASTSFPLVVQLIPGDGFELPLIGGNVLHNDIQGADGDMEIYGVSHSGNNATESNGTFVIQGTYGTLTLYGNGSYSYQVTTVGSLIPDNAVDTFSYTIADSDGDLSTAELNINLNAVEELPTVYEGTQGVDSFLLTNSTTGKGQFAVSSSGYDAVASTASADVINLDTALHIKAGDSNDYVDLGISRADNTVETGSALPNVASQMSQEDVLSSKFMSARDILDNDGKLKQNVLEEVQPNTDTVNLGLGDDTVYGGEGSQMVFGGAGNDLLIGGEGIDGLRGGEGNDTIIGGLGDDVLRGDGGADTFVWRAGETGTDHIIDFNVNEDKLDLSDLLQGEENGNLEDYLSFSFERGSTTIEIDANRDGTVDQRIVLDGVDLADEYGLASTDESGIINGLLGNGTGPLIVDTQADTGAAQAVGRIMSLDEDHKTELMP
ncbi:type I secretion C-terminal target domain-containing protein, partial [Shewanella litorisediminis]